MALTLVTDVTQEPVSMQEQKLHLRIDADDDDLYISTCISAARQWVEGQTKRGLLTQTWDYTIDNGWPVKYGVHRIDLPINPVESVTSISYVDSNGATQTLATSEYTSATRSHGSYIVEAYDATWPDVRCVPDAITVRFVAGEDDAPGELHQAIMILAGHYYENRETGSGAPEAVEALISPFRRVSF